jgi:hypothetical protein
MTVLLFQQVNHWTLLSLRNKLLFERLSTEIAACIRNRRTPERFLIELLFHATFIIVCVYRNVSKSQKLSSVLWYITLCSLVKVTRLLKGTFHIHSQDWVRQGRNHDKAGNKQSLFQFRFQINNSRRDSSMLCILVLVHILY